MNLEIKSDWDTADYNGNRAFTLRLIKENGECFYVSSMKECFENEYKTHQALSASFFEILHIAYPDAIKQEMDERKKMLEETK